MGTDPADWAVCNDRSCCDEEKARLHREAVARRAAAPPEPASDPVADRAAALRREIGSERTALVLLGESLAAASADLEGFIERRAAELAKPAIEEAERSVLVSDQRVTDLQAEFARQLRPLERKAARYWPMKAAIRAVLAAAGKQEDEPEMTSELVEALEALREAADGN